MAHRLLDAVNEREWRGMPARHAELRDDRAALLVRLFRDHGAASEDEIASLALDGDLFRDGRARFKLDWIDGTQILSDWSSGDPNEVLPPGETTAILYRAARRPPRRARILDLGCGSGTLALLLRDRAGAVTGVDINPRSVELARRNAEANGATNCEFRLGSLYEPVAGEKFDLIVCQPPYLPSPPDGAHVFLHGGIRGDELACSVLAGSIEHLTPRGRALVFSDWMLRAGESLGGRIPKLDARVLLIHSPAITPEAYASQYGNREMLARAGIQSIRQCLAVVERGGPSISTRTALPHEWAGIEIRQAGTPLPKRIPRLD